jgi:hypothetical protein
MPFCTGATLRERERNAGLTAFRRAIVSMVQTPILGENHGREIAYAANLVLLESVSVDLSGSILMVVAHVVGQESLQVLRIEHDPDQQVSSTASHSVRRYRSAGALRNEVEPACSQMLSPRR